MSRSSIPSISLMADLGESFGAYELIDDEQLLDIVTVANVACGFHAGDPQVMDRTVAACVNRGVDVGAHPGFRDLAGFGRRAIDMTSYEVYTDTLYQIGALGAVLSAHRSAMTHVTPHGRLGNLVVTEPKYADGVADAVLAFDPTLTVVTQEGALARAARDRDLTVAIMGLADRQYLADGTLMSRRQPGAVHTDPEMATAQVRQLLTQSSVLADDGTDVSVHCDTILVHGDTPGVKAIGDAIRDLLRGLNIELRGIRSHAVSVQ